MAVSTTYKFQLDKTSKKVICPGCGQKRAVRYQNIETNEFLPDQVCRCDRESSCGYHYAPKQYLTDIGAGLVPLTTKTIHQPIEKPIDFMPIEYVEKSMTGFDQTNFAVYISSLFGVEIADSALKKYFVGRSRNDGGKACIFWRIDKAEKLSTGKIMCYDPESGKRNKEINPAWVHTQFQNYNFRLCFFGEHLLNEYPDKAIGLVESEKTAIIASLFFPDMVWIATGGNSGCKWREWSVFKVLQDRDIVLFPDFGYFNKKTEKTCYQEWSDRANAIKERMSCNIKVSRVLEDMLPVEERANDYDLADMLIKTEKSGGLAMSEIPGYPVIWDLQHEFKSLLLCNKYL